jgi:hypothetical protein
MDEQPDAPEGADVPKYRRPGFLEKQQELWRTAGRATRITRRYGDNDAPIEPVTGIDAARSLEPIADFNDPNDR